MGPRSRNGYGLVAGASIKRSGRRTAGMEQVEESSRWLLEAAGGGELDPVDDSCGSGWSVGGSDRQPIGVGWEESDWDCSNWELSLCCEF